MTNRRVEIANPESTDVFGKIIADGTKGELDIASHYQYSPERWRIFKDGTRQFPAYGSVTGFTDHQDRFELAPAQGETLSMETTERPRYTVQYELYFTFAARVSRDLESGDRVRVGPYDESDGWFFEKNDTHSGKDVDVVTLRNGTEKLRETKTLRKALTAFTRLSVRTPWYDIGRQVWGQSHSQSGYQQNKVIGRTSLDDEKGPEVGNLPIRFEVQRGSGSSALSLDVGSVGVATLGDTKGRFRVKRFSNTINLGVTGSWKPLLALRTAPDQNIINAQLRSIDAVLFGGNDNVEVAAKGFDPSKVANSTGSQLTDSDFSAPNIIQTQTSAIETSTAVDQVADSSGTLQASMTNPGGFQIGYSLLSTDKRAESPSSSDAKQSISPRDIVVVLAKSPATGDVTFTSTIEEDW